MATGGAVCRTLIGSGARTDWEGSSWRFLPVVFVRVISRSKNVLLEIHVVRKGSWKKSEVGKFLFGKLKLKLERMKLENSSQSSKIFHYLVTILKTFQLRSVCSILNENFLTSEFQN